MKRIPTLSRFFQKNVEDFLFSNDKIFISCKEKFLCYNLEDLELIYEIDTAYWRYFQLNNFLIAQYSSCSKVFIINEAGENVLILDRYPAINQNLTYEDKILLATYDQLRNLVNYWTLVNLSNLDFSEKKWDYGHPSEKVIGLIDNNLIIQGANVKDDLFYIHAISFTTQELKWKYNFSDLNPNWKTQRTTGGNHFTYKNNFILSIREFLFSINGLSGRVNWIQKSPGYLYLKGNKGYCVNLIKGIFAVINLDTGEEIFSHNNWTDPKFWSNGGAINRHKFMIKVVEEYLFIPSFQTNELLWYDNTSCELIDKISFGTERIWDMENFDFRNNLLFIKNIKNDQVNYTLNTFKL